MDSTVIYSKYKLIYNTFKTVNIVIGNINAIGQDQGHHVTSQLFYQYDGDPEVVYKSLSLEPGNLRLKVQSSNHSAIHCHDKKKIFDKTVIHHAQ